MRLSLCSVDISLPTNRFVHCTVQFVLSAVSDRAQSALRAGLAPYVSVSAARGVAGGVDDNGWSKTWTRRQELRCRWLRCLLKPPGCGMTMGGKPAELNQ